MIVSGYTVTAKQTLTDWNDSPATTSDFTIAPAAPAITSPPTARSSPSTRARRSSPAPIWHRASVQVTVNGKSYNAVVDGTTWSVTLPHQLASGNYAITAVQQWGDFQSLTTHLHRSWSKPNRTPEHTTPPAPTSRAHAPAPAPAPRSHRQ